MSSLTAVAGIERHIRRVLDSRLEKTSGKPLVLGLSGGGDSVALALVAASWARSHNRPLYFITIDHGLNVDAAHWTDSCAALAARLKVGFRQLTWQGDKPRTGIPAAARIARHQLLANAAQDLGATVIILGHTADDCAEAEVMRQTGSSTPDPTEWSPSPVWPEGRGLFLLRPMLEIRRCSLRQFLAARQEAWIEDPANENLQFARSRARLELISNPKPEPTRSSPTGLAALAKKVTFENGFCLDRQALREASWATARMLIGRACLCAGGGSRPPRSARLDRLTDALRGNDSQISTLVGCRVNADHDQVFWTRNSGDIRRIGHGQLPVETGLARVWDGRFEIVAKRPVTIVPLLGHGSSLSPAAKKRLRLLARAARPSLPVILGDPVTAPTLEATTDIRVTDLTWHRFLAACGCLSREHALGLTRDMSNTLDNRVGEARAQQAGMVGTLHV